MLLTDNHRRQYRAQNRSTSSLQKIGLTSQFLSKFNHYLKSRDTVENSKRRRLRAPDFVYVRRLYSDKHIYSWSRWTHNIELETTSCRKKANPGEHLDRYTTQTLDLFCIDLARFASHIHFRRNIKFSCIIHHYSA